MADWSRAREVGVTASRVQRFTMRTAHRVVSVVAVLLQMKGTARAQTATGQILGTIKDATGGILPKVKVTVENQRTGLKREAMTNDEGTYVVPLLPVGVYFVTAELSGFKLGIQ